MGDVRMWVVVMWVALLVAMLLAYARGPEHHRGTEVGAYSHVSTTIWR